MVYAHALKGAQALRERYPTYHAVWAALVTVIADRAVTLAYWQHESNYVVATLGAYWWSVATVAMLGILSYTWYAADLWRFRIGHGIVWLGAGMHLLAVSTNLLLVHGYY